MSDPRFCIIPARALEAPDLKGMDLKVLCYFGKHADKNGWWRLSQVKMAEYFSCARSTVQLSVTRLIEAELLEKHPVETDSGRDSAHYWRVVFDHGAPEVGAPVEVIKSRANAAENNQKTDENEPKNPPIDPCRQVGTPADISAPPADPASAPPADPASAPSITTHLNDPLSRSAQARAPDAEREDSGNDGDDKKTIKRQFTELEGGWPSRLSDSLEKAEVQWNLLTDDDRTKALARRDDYIQACKDAGRSYSIALATYIKERMWTKLPKASPKAGAPVVLKKYGHSWMAYRLSLLSKPRRIWHPSGFIKSQVEAGNSGAFDDSRWRAEFPLLAQMDADAEKLKDLHLRPTAIVPSHDGYVQIENDAKGEAFIAWADWHQDNDYPWIEPPDCIKWIWVPSEFPPATTTAVDDETQEFLRTSQ